MPVFSLTIPDVDQAVVRPAIIDIIHQVQDIVKIKNDTHIFFPGDIKTNPTAKSSIDQENDRRALYANDRYIFIEVDANYNEDMLSSTAVHRYEHLPVFLDQDVNTAVWPVYLTTDYTISFRYRTPSKTEAVAWRDDIRTRISQMRDIFLHDITYHYTLPEVLCELLATIYEYKCRLLKDPPTLHDYIFNNSTRRLSILGDMTNKNNDLAISEKQCRIVGQFDFSPLPEKVEREDDIGSWICAFSYKLRFEKPALIGCRHPVMIYNRILPAKYVTYIQSQNDDENTHKQNASISLAALSIFEAQRQLDTVIDLYVPYRIPEFDEINVRIGPAGYGSMLSVLTEVDEVDLRGLFNLYDLDPYSIDPDILEFIVESEYPYIGNAYHSILYLGLYENHKFKGNRAITCDAGLNLSTIIDLQLNKNHHVVFSILVDLPYLKQEAVNRLKKYPKAFVKIVQCINETLRDNPELITFTKKGSVSDADFHRFFRFIVGYDNVITPGPGTVYQAPVDMEYFTTLDPITGTQVVTRASKPTIRDGVRPNDVIPKKYRGYAFEDIRNNFVGFNKTQLTSVIAIRK